MFATISSYAESIIITQKSGSETTLELSTNPVITFAGEDMVVTNDFTTIVFPLDDVDSYVVNNMGMGIQELKHTPRYYDGHIVFTGVKEGTFASVFTLDGKSVGKYFSNSSSVLDINIGNLPKGLYIIDAMNNKIKVTNK